MGHFQASLDGVRILAIDISELGAFLIDQVPIVIRLEHVENRAYSGDALTFLRTDAMIVQDKSIAEILGGFLRSKRAQREVILGAVELDMADIAGEDTLSL